MQRDNDSRGMRCTGYSFQHTSFHYVQENACSSAFVLLHIVKGSNKYVETNNRLSIKYNAYFVSEKKLTYRQHCFVQKNLMKFFSSKTT